MRIVLIMLLLINLAVAKKVALVIGNGAYSQGHLPNPTKDAKLIAKNLRAVGFTVTPVNNIKTAPQMKEVINAFAKKLNKNDIAVVYYAGHGVQCLGKNYLMPTKANVVKGGQLASEAVDLNFLIGGLGGIKLGIVMLDACRNNTYPSCSKSQTRGLVQPSVAKRGGMIISFATAENDIALDGNGDHSPYALALSKFMNQSLPIETFFTRVGGEVLASSGQRPMFKNSFYERFSFGGGGYVPPTPQPTSKPTSKWIIPSNSVCTNNGGKLYKGVCQANWENATKICRASGGKLPSREDLHKVIRDCGGSLITYEDKDWASLTYTNKNNSHYQSCYKQRGFSDKDWYWTREEKDSSYAWTIGFHDGYDLWNYKSDLYYALCVR